MECVFGAAGAGIGVLAKVAYDYVAEKVEKEKQFMAMDKNYPVTRYPTIPDILKHSVGWKTQHERVGYALGAENEQYASAESILFMQNYLNERMDAKDYIVPKNAVAVSQIYRDCFEVGASCHEFIPKTFEHEPNAFFTYQMLQPTIQLTFYNVDGTAYLAGITYYLTPKDKKLASLYCERTALNAATCLSPLYPPRDRATTHSYMNQKLYGRYCSTAKKHVLIELSKKGVAHHVVMVPREEKRKFESCKECAEEHENYKFVPKVWKKKVQEPVKSVAPAVKAVVKVAPIEKKVEKEEKKKEEQVDEDKKEYVFLDDENLDVLSIN